MKTKKLVCSVAACSVAALVPVWACGGTPQLASYDRAALLDELANQVIVPGYSEVLDDAKALHTATGALCKNVSSKSLDAARSAWSKLFLAWQRTAAYSFGPVTDDHLGDEMATWPTKPASIEQQVSGTGAIDAHAIDALGDYAKGLYALEYLLYGGADEVSALKDARRCAYTDALADHVARTSQRIVDDWSPDGENFAHTLATAGESGNDTYPAQLSAISALVSTLVTTLEDVKDMKLGQPLGLSAKGGAKGPDAVESPYADLSLEAMQANMDSVKAIWKSTDHNFDAYLRTRNPQLADKVLADLDKDQADLKAIPAPFATYVAGKDHSLGKTAHEDLDELQRLFTTDVDVAFAVNLMFNNNDGD